MSIELTALIRALLINIPDHVSRESREGFPARYASGHPAYADTTSTGHIRITKDARDLEYLTSDGHGFVISRALVIDARYHADILVVSVGLGGASLTITFDVAQLGERGRQRLIKKLRF